MGTPAKNFMREGRARFDTIRLWDSYRELAILWRAVTLIQMPIAAVALTLAIFFFVTADVVVEVPHRPDPGRYSVNKLPDSEFISVAVQFLNLVYTYQPYTAKKQFLNGARRYLWEPALTRFQEEHAEQELPAIKELSRSQIFYINSRQMRVMRTGNHVVIYVPGTRHRLVGDTPLPPEDVAWWIKMKTIPHSIGNEFNIAIIDLRLESLKDKKTELGDENRNDFLRKDPKEQIRAADAVLEESQEKEEDVETEEVASWR